MYQTRREKKTEGQRQVDTRDRRARNEKGSGCGERNDKRFVLSNNKKLMARLASKVPFDVLI